MKSAATLLPRKWGSAVACFRKYILRMIQDFKSVCTIAQSTAVHAETTAHPGCSLRELTAIDKERSDKVLEAAIYPAAPRVMLLCAVCVG